MEWFSTLSLALGSAWTSGINLYATVAVLGTLQKFALDKPLPGGLDVLNNWWIIGIAAGLYLVEFFADKIPYVDTVWDVVHTFIRIPAGIIVAYSATNELDPTIYIPAALIGGGLSAGLELGAFDRRRRHRVCRCHIGGICTIHHRGNSRSFRARILLVLPQNIPSHPPNAACYQGIFCR
jgi:hypothetical protein